MSQRGSLALIPRTKKGFVLFWTAILMLTLAFQYAAATTPKGVLASAVCDSFAIFTTDANGDTNNQNQYASKPEVYLNGGPGPSGTLTEGTTVYYRVEEPDGTPLSEIRSTVAGPGGEFRVQLAPFDTTSNPGGEYSVSASTISTLPNGNCTKNDNFKVDGPGTLKVTKTVEGGQASGSFPFTVDCGIAGDFGGSIPAGGSKSFEVDNLAECTVTEGTLPAPPAGYTWGSPTYTGNPGTVHTDSTTTIGIVNHLNVIPAPAIGIDKGVSLSANGTFGPSLTAEIGTTVYYRIRVTNTGNVTLSGLTLVDNKTSLSCTIPATLAAGDHFDCNYSSTVTPGPTENTATASSEEAGPVTDTATVTGTTTPGIRVRKAVGLSADGPFINILNVAPGTPVFYRITVTNTGNVVLTDLTLVDDHFSLAGCTIPETLAIGDSFNCDYSAVSAETSTHNTATADSKETEPDTDDATVNPVAQQLTPVVGINKTNNAPAAPDGAKSGDTVTYTLAYTIADGPADNATVKDVLPAGVTYVANSATDSENGEFVFAGYDSATRTLTWTAVQVSENDSVSYKVTVDANAAGIVQPLKNTACIVATSAAQACDTSEVLVLAGGVEAETSVPTAPRTDVLDSNGTATPGMNLGLVLLIIGALAFAVLFVTPMPASTKNRIRRR